MPKRSRRGGGEIEKIGEGSSAKFRARVSAVVIRDGKSVRARASKTFATQREAQAWINEQSGQSVTASVGTVADWIKEWLTIHKSNVTAKTLAGDTYTAKKYIIPYLGPVKLRTLDSMAVSKWLGTLKNADISDSERQKAGACLRKCLAVAHQHKLIPNNPTKGVKLPTPVRAEKVVMTPDELKLLIAEADKVSLGHCLRVWVDAGLRPAEMMALHWTDIDLAAGCVTIRRSLDGITNKPKTTKTAKSNRTIPLSKATLTALETAKPIDISLSPVVMPDANGGYFWASNFADAFNRMIDAAGLKGKGYNRYTFRHTMASILLSKGVNILVVSRRLGHSTVTMTLNTYSHLMPNDAQRAADVMGDVIG
jgi:integrase